MKKEKIGGILLILIGAIAIVGFGLSSPIAQDVAYHNFSDTNRYGKIPNFWNVISNLPFLIVGLFGIFQLKNMKRVKLQFLLFFIGISFVSLGSAYYHYSPNNDSLVWDRLPMTIAFMSLISVVISEFIDKKKGKILLFPLLLIGLVSILYWVELGDLRLYAFVQFYPVLAIPVILIFFKSDNTSPKGFWFLLISYIIAKMFETFDFEIHNTLKFISGHSLKHIIISMGIYSLIHLYVSTE